MTVKIDMWNTSGNPPVVNIGNTSDYETISGTTYNTQILGAPTWYTWQTVTIPNTYHFQNNVIVAMSGSETYSNGLKVDVAADNATLKKNMYFDGGSWSDKTGTWIFAIRMEYDSSIGNQPPVYTPIEAFNQNITGGVTPSNVQFTNNSSNIPTSYL